jgi:S-adenosylmethionine hydrolase
MPSEQRPIITLTTDFGQQDAYVAQMKAVLLRHAPLAMLVDVTHAIAPQDVLAGAIALERAVAAFGPWTIHLVVIDPTVGTGRRLLLAVIGDQIVVCPDNGLITWAMRRQGPMRAYEITWRPLHTSATFHGRDIMAPVAGMIAAGQSPDLFCQPIANPVVLSVAPAIAPLSTGVIIHILLAGRDSVVVRVGPQAVGPLRNTYADVEPGKALALIGSSGLLEIAVRDGSAAQTLNLHVGDPVHFEP